MPTIAFPPNPTNGQVHTHAGKTWAFNGIGWVAQSGISADAIEDAIGYKPADSEEVRKLKVHLMLGL